MSYKFQSAICHQRGGGGESMISSVSPVTTSNRQDPLMSFGDKQEKGRVDYIPIIGAPADAIIDPPAEGLMCCCGGMVFIMPEVLMLGFSMR